MKRFFLGILLIIFCVSLVGCFASNKETTTSEEESTAPTETLQTTVTTLATVPTTTIPAEISEFPCTAFATDSLNVRRTPNLDHYAVGGLSKGEQVTILGKEGDFYKIEFSWKDNSEGQNLSGTTAYVSAQYISLKKTSDIPTVATTVSTTIPAVTTAQQ